MANLSEGKETGRDIASGKKKQKITIHNKFIVERDRLKYYSTSCYDIFPVLDLSCNKRI